MSALERPAEVLLLASFAASGRAEAAARALLHGGLDADHLALLARDTWGTAFGAVPHSLVLQLPGLGRLRAGGALAVELGAGSVDVAGPPRLGVALRRMGLSLTEVPRLERALRDNRILVLAAVSRWEAFLWGRLLHSAGADSLSARPRLGPWPPGPTRARPSGREPRAARSRTAS